MLSPYCPLSPSHADIYTLHCHAYSHLPLILIRPHAGCLHIYFCLPHPVHAIATETGLTALLVLQIHLHFYTLYIIKKKTSFFICFPPRPQKLPMCTINLSSFPSGCQIRQPIFFFLSKKHARSAGPCSLLLFTACH